MTEIDQKSAKSLYFSCYYFNAVYFLEILILMWQIQNVYTFHICELITH
jgi:hypothetical protein